MIANCDLYIEPQPPPQQRGVPQGSAGEPVSAVPVDGAEMTLNCRSNFGWSQSGQGGFALWETRSSCFVLQFEQINSYNGMVLVNT